MIYTIKNEYLTVEINSLGAELWSVKDADGCEYIWQGDPEFWSGRAPIMFPICGRLYTGKYTYLGKEYELGSHGFARHSEFALKSQGESHITLSLSASEETKKVYPFDFEFDVSFILSGKELKVEYKVKNTDNTDIIFALGGHPAFNVPLDKDLCFEDYLVEFEKSCDAVRVDFSPTCFCTYEDKIYTQGGTKSINLRHDLFDDDAIFLYNTPKKIKLYSPKGKRSVTMKFDTMKYVGLWHATKKPAPYLCIEPWASVPSMDGVVDDFSWKKEMIHLAPEYTHKRHFEIIFE
ncbi:MAG: aldose 1-epimerase family protein [Clostridia bacterium]|nr:aldose 1-epimerase family protein [Clostridia bacterium]